MHVDLTLVSRRDHFDSKKRRTYLAITRAAAMSLSCVGRETYNKRLFAVPRLRSLRRDELMRLPSSANLYPATLRGGEALSATRSHQVRGMGSGFSHKENKNRARH